MSADAGPSRRPPTPLGMFLQYGDLVVQCYVIDIGNNRVQFEVTG
jgi:hypothetical protein